MRTAAEEKSDEWNDHDDIRDAGKRLERPESGFGKHAAAVMRLVRKMESPDPE